LRVNNVNGKHMETVRTIFTYPHYASVARREIDTIRVSTNREEGQPFPFLTGKSVETLHFRRRHPLFSLSEKNCIAARVRVICMNSIMPINREDVGVKRWFILGDCHKRGMVLCSAHFEDSQFVDSVKRNKLKQCAIPTIFSVPNPPRRLMSSRHPPTERHTLQTCTSSSENSTACNGNNLG
jgi:hypothetical protein